jgi:prostaglandin-endoperoxide synthase 2
MLVSNTKIARALISNFPRFWHFIESVPLLRRWTNRLFISILTTTAPPRPHPLSLWSPTPRVPPPPPASYISWTGLVDRTYTGRHLPPADDAYTASLPLAARLEGLFVRKAEMLPCPKSSALFGFFAQWFTDSFLRTDPTDNHEIDLCQIYGLCAADTAIIRSGIDGKLRSQDIKGEEYPPYLFQSDGSRVRDENLELSYIDKRTGQFRHPLLEPPFDAPERKARLFVTGLERGNSTVFYSAINTLFLREHNRLCDELKKSHPAWDDDRLFETARNVNIVGLLKIIVEDYINHLSPAVFRMFVEVGWAETQDWYRTNRICAEFNLLYRWHQLIPTELSVGGRSVPNREFRFNNSFLIQHGIETVIEAASTQRGGSIVLENTADFLVLADLAALEKSRKWGIRPYNEYRERFGLSPVRSFEELTGEGHLAAELAKLYGSVSQVEFPVGLLAEARGKREMLGDLMTYMVGIDAFSQALTNPLLSRNVYGEAAFSHVGVAELAKTSTFADIARRNASIGERTVNFGMKPIPGSYGCRLFRWLTRWINLVLMFTGWVAFFERHQRKYGSTVFRVNLYQPTIVMLDHRAIAALFESRDLVQDYGFSWAIPARELVGNVPPSIFGAGPAHDRPKALYLRMLEQRLRTLVATFDKVADEFIARWRRLGSFGFRDELEDFAITFLCEWILGKRYPDSKALRYLYSNIFSPLHQAAPVTRHIPWSTFSRSLATYRDFLAFVKAAPNFNDILALAKSEGLTDEDAVAKQIAFVLGMNSFLGIQNVLKSVVGELGRSAGLQTALRSEMEHVLGSPPASDLHKLADPGRMPALDRALRELLRLHPPVSFIFGRATSHQTIQSSSGTFALDKGELVMGVIPMAHLDETVFPSPDRFAPERFTDPRMSDYLIWPRGLHDRPATPENRTCPGKDVAILIAKLFCVALVSKCTWSLKHPPRWGRRLFSLNVAAPRGDLRVESFK